MKSAGKFTLFTALLLLLASIPIWAQEPELLPRPRRLDADATNGRRLFCGPQPGEMVDRCCDCFRCHKGDFPPPFRLSRDDLVNKSDDYLFNVLKKGLCEIHCSDRTRVPASALVPGQTLLTPREERELSQAYYRVYCTEVPATVNKRRVRGMNPHTDLTDSEIEDIIAYLRSNEPDCNRR
jgi:hypothetical protein